jgi:hypothetical protein
MANENLLRDLLIGITGSVAGAAIVALAAYGRDAFQTARNRSARWKHEVEEWRTGQVGRRQAITNEYVFEVLRFLLLGNLLWVFPEIIVPFTWRNSVIDELHLWVNSGFLLVGLLSFYVGLSKTIRYLRLRRTYNPFEEARSDQKRGTAA